MGKERRQQQYTSISARHLFRFEIRPPSSFLLFLSLSHPCQPFPVPARPTRFGAPLLPASSAAAVPCLLAPLFLRCLGRLELSRGFSAAPHLSFFFFTDVCTSASPRCTGTASVFPNCQRHGPQQKHRLWFVFFRDSWLFRVTLRAHASVKSAPFFFPSPPHTPSNDYENFSTPPASFVLVLLRSCVSACLSSALAASQIVLFGSFFCVFRFAGSFAFVLVEHTVSGLCCLKASGNKRKRVTTPP